MTVTRDSMAAGLVERLRSGDVRALARAVSLVENGASESSEILSACFPFTGHALRIGVTGAPGAGKSTLVDRLARGFREAGKTVGVVAVDPSSPFTGGAILGDRIRIREQPDDPGFYVRSMATRGTLGGLAGTTVDVASVIEASGKELILIETVGVGQDEIDIVRLADITLVVLVPGMGDDVQSLKAGVMEIADIFVVNKADREGAERVEGEIRAMQSFAVAHSEWVAPVVKTVATTGEGMDELAASIAGFREWLGEEDRMKVRRRARWRDRIAGMVQAELLRTARRHGLTAADLESAAERVAQGEEDPWKLVQRLVQKVFRES
jgi:LAO/AO transport system kinase